ncbi:MAG: cyclic nucleotide-binding domain-containing protein [Chloroflexota bacterium]
MLLAALSIGAALPLMLLIPRHFGSRIVALDSHPPPQTIGGADQSGWRHVLSRYTWLIFALIFVWFIASFVTDNIFYDRTSYRFPNEQELATFLGYFAFARGALTLVVTLIINRGVTRRFGVRTATLALPITILVLAVLMLLAGWLTQVNGVIPAVGAVFLLAVALKLVDKSVGDADEQSTLSILYQPLPVAERDRAQTLGAGVVKPIAIGTAGLLLLALDRWLGISGFRLTIILVGLAVVWIVVAALVGRQYLSQVARAVTRRRLSGLVPELADAAGIGYLKSLLDSPQPQRALYALRVLAELDAAEHLEATVRVMDHPDPAVRSEALHQAVLVNDRLSPIEMTPLVDSTCRMADMDPDPAVRGAALSTLAHIEPTAETAERLRAALAGEEAQGIGALAGLLTLAVTQPDLFSTLEAEQVVEDTLAGHDRVIVLEAIAATPDDLWAGASPLDNRLADIIAQSLATSDSAEQTAALQAAAVLRHPKLWPQIIHLLDAGSISSEAQATLESGWMQALPAIAESWKGRLSIKTRTRLTRIIGRIGMADPSGNPAALKILAADLDHPEPAVRTQILRALSRAGYRLPYDVAASQLTRETEEAAWALAALVDLGGLQDHLERRLEIIYEPLESHIILTQNRILYLLSLMYDRQLILEGQRAFDQARRRGWRPEALERRAYALESLDLLLEPEHKRLVFPVLEDPHPESARMRLRQLFPTQCRPLSPDERLAVLIDESGPRGLGWLHAVAVYLAGQARLEPLRANIVEATMDSDPMVRETAVWSSAQLDGHTSPSQNMLTIEKLILLKRVPLFAEMPNAILAERAGQVDELMVPNKTILFKKGDEGTSLYIIAEGRVRIHDGATTLNELGELAVFGEMAALTGEPRSATATTTGQTRLLRLDRHMLGEMIDEDPSAGISIVHVVAGYLRHQVTELTALRAF